MSVSLNDQTAIRDWGHGHGLLEQTIEELPAVARQSSVEAKRELIEVIPEMVPRDSSLVYTQQPPLQ